MNSAPGEFDLIRRYFAPLAAGEPGALGLGDDAAVIKPADGHSFVVTADTIAEGVHFLPDDPPDQIAKKALRVNLSDLASMGAAPRAYTLALALGRDRDEKWVAAFASGLADDQQRFGVTLIGGDTVAAPGATTLNVTAIGEVGEGRELTRGGARAGDDIWVSGTIGDAGLGLRVLRDELSIGDASLNAAAISAYRLPEPRIALGNALFGLATGTIDVSDGLVADLGHICEQSSTGAVVESPAVPLSEIGVRLAADDPAWLTRLITGGDDYELLFSAPPVAESEISALAEQLALRITKIGAIEPGSELRVLDHAGNSTAIGSAGYRHF